MPVKHVADWVESSRMLRESMELYQSQQQYASLTKVIDDLIDYIERYSGKWLNEKTIKRDAGNRPESKKIYKIPDWRLKIYTRWFFEDVQRDRDRIVEWLETSAYSAPGKLLAELDRAQEKNAKNQYEIKSNVPSLKQRLWGGFLGRRKELEKLVQWADNQRYPIAVLYGFGGNGKTTLQQKVGEDFLHHAACPLRWPYQGAVWNSAVDYARGHPSLLDVLREIAITFDLYDCLKRCNRAALKEILPEVLRKDVKDFLENRRILILLDNFETVSKANQLDILKFLGDLRGSSQTLISTRYRPDWLLHEEADGMYAMAHILIRVDGLTAENTRLLIQEYLQAKSLAQSDFQAQDITELIRLTRNNPKTILAVLGLVEQGMFLPHLLEAMAGGKTEADTIYSEVIDCAWEELLEEADKAVLMAKAFFQHSVCDSDLGRVAGVDEEQLREAIKKLSTISFFEFDRTPQQTLRIRTHPLAQDFILRVIRDYPGFEGQAEKRWWEHYAPEAFQTIAEAPNESRPYFEDDIANILDFLEKQFQQESSRAFRAANWLMKPRGLAQFLDSWGRHSDVLRLAELALDIGIRGQHPGLIGECALRLLARIYIKRRRFDEADRYIGLAIEQNTGLRDRWLAAMIDATRSFLHLYRGYFNAAEQFYQSALQSFIDLGDEYEISSAYICLGAIVMDSALKGLEQAVDTDGVLTEQLNKAEGYFRQAETYIKKEVPNWQTQRRLAVIRANRGCMARLRGELEPARDLIQSCLGRTESIMLDAHLFRELALIEHLAGNRELAHSYEEQGLEYFRKIGLIDTMYDEHAFRIIDRMKEEGSW